MKHKSPFLFFWRTGLLCLFLFSLRPAGAQTADTLRLSLAQTDQQFLERNYQLLAQRYQVEISGAGITQAGLRPNPNLWFQGNLYNPQTHKFLQYGPPTVADRASGQYNSGYYAVQLQQIITLAGKRSKLVSLAESNRSLAQLAFRDLLRTLRYQLYSAYAELYFDSQAYDLLREEESQQIRLVESYRILQRTGGVAPYEVTRLEAALQDLRANIVNYQSQLADDQGQLRTLLRLGPNSYIVPTELPLVTPNIPALPIALDSALANRPDAALAQEQITNAQRSLTLEKARRTPDLTTALYFEKYSNAYDNFTGFQLQMDLPVRNRNQGNIQAAQIQVQTTQRGLENQQNVVQSDVQNAYSKLNSFYQLNASNPADYQARLQNISAEATRSYNNRVISLLDYLDKIRTYQSAQLNLINLQNNLFQTQQLFNYVTNTRFF